MQIWTVSFCNLPIRLDSTVLFLTNYLKKRLLVVLSFLMKIICQEQAHLCICSLYHYTVSCSEGKTAKTILPLSTT